MPKTLTEEEVEGFREKICQAATRQFAQCGFNGVTLRGLADEVGCSRMTPYRYFKNKEEILDAVRTAAYGRLADVTEKATDGLTDPVSRLQAFGQAYLRFAVENPDAYRLMHEFSAPEKSNCPKLLLQLERIQKPLTDCLEVSVDAGIVNKDPQLVIDLFVAGMHGVVSLHLANRLRDGRSFEQLSHEMVDTLFRGLVHSNVEVNAH